VKGIGGTEWEILNGKKHAFGLGMDLRRQVEALHHAGRDVPPQLPMETSRRDPIEAALAARPSQRRRHFGRTNVGDEQIRSSE
jgi:hypothetical protein